MILTADKGVSIVVMDRYEYIKKAEEWLSQPTYRSIPADPTTKYKNMPVITLLKTKKAEGGINKAVYRRLYPTGAGSPKFYGLHKVHKDGMPLRTMVSSIGAVRYEKSKELARILKPLIGRSSYHVQKEHQTLHTTSKRHPFKNRWMHHVLWCKGTFYICAYSTCH